MLEKIVRTFIPLLRASALMYALGCGDSEPSNPTKNVTSPDSTSESTDFDRNAADAEPTGIDVFTGKDEITYPDGSSEEIIEPACEKKTFYWDGDGDGYPIKYSIEACNPPEGYIPISNPELIDKDCDDGNDKIHPLAKETCNNIDDNCDGYTDEGFVHSLRYKDNDGDGYGNPGGLENLCNNQTEGYVKNKEDCNDNNSDINPTALELCNGIDDNCDSSTDESLTQDCSNSCGEGYKTCVNGNYVNCTAPLPGAEICDGLDNNCNGAVDEGLL
ncbi:putative metal-binding motif-containing protein, partial [Candidatus Woesearchaeota archaeon]|nr:putative metal-binding motif-containing protein [Candidatus Woesearchaeota archaeon]